MAGNSNSGRRNKPFEQMLNRMIAEAGEKKEALRNIALQLIAAAESGDLQAIREFADRTDGKPAQAIVGDEDNPLKAVLRIERVIVDPQNRDGSNIPAAPESGTR